MRRLRHSWDYSDVVHTCRHCGMQRVLTPDPKDNWRVYVTYYHKDGHQVDRQRYKAAGCRVPECKS